MTTAQLATNNNNQANPSQQVKPVLQCPNPDCGSSEIKTKSKMLAYWTKKGKLQLDTSNNRSSLYRGLMVFVSQSAIWVNVATKMGIWFLTIPMILLSTFAVGHYVLSKRPKVVMLVHKCGHCKCKWSLLNNTPNAHQELQQIYEMQWKAVEKEMGGVAKASAVINYSRNYADFGDYQSALQCAEEGLRRAENVPGAKQILICNAKLTLAEMLVATGSYARATELANDHQAFYKKENNWQYIAHGMRIRGLCKYYEGLLNEARSLLEEALIYYAKMGDLKNTALCLEVLADIAVDEGETVVAAQLYGSAENFREASFCPMPIYRREIYQQHVAQLDWQLDSSVKAVAWETGRRMSPVRAVNFAINRK